MTGCNLVVDLETQFEKAKKREKEEGGIRRVVVEGKALVGA